MKGVSSSRKLFSVVGSELSYSKYFLIVRATGRGDVVPFAAKLRRVGFNVPGLWEIGAPVQLAPGAQTTLCPTGWARPRNC
jgi:hypothetical protein